MKPDEDKQRLEEALGRGVVEERIDKSTLTPLFSTDHDHQYVPDRSDETDEFRAEICRLCPVGRLIRKT